MSRYYNYLPSNNSFNDGFYIVKKIIKDIKEYDLSLVDDKEQFIKLQEEVTNIDNELGNDSYELRKKINDDLISPSVVNYYYENKKYPLNASPTGEKVNKLFNRIFEIEDEVQIISAKIWNNKLTPFSDIENGKPFSIIGHSGYGYIVTPTSSKYRNNDYENTISFSCSLFNEHSMNLFSSNLVMIFDLNPNNFIAACNYDCATSKTEDYKNIRTLHEVNGKYLSAGFMYNNDLDRIITKSECPTSVVNKINNNPENTINEFIIDKNKSIPQGLVLFSSGYDFPLVEYISATKMKYDYNLDLKVINKQLYFNNNLTKEEQINSLYENINNCLSMYQDYEIFSIINLLDSFIEDVIIPLKLDKEIEEIIINKINDLKNIKSLHTSI